MPGPSDYKSDSKSVLPGKPAYTIAGRQGSALTKHSTPGPGAYAVRGDSKLLGSHPNTPGYSIPSSSRGAGHGYKVPGPGGKTMVAYHLSDQAHKSDPALTTCDHLRCFPHVLSGGHCCGMSVHNSDVAICLANSCRDSGSSRAPLT